MTYEDAIKTLEVAIAEVEWEYPMEYAAALEMAIKALQAQQGQKHYELAPIDQYDGLKQKYVVLKADTGECVENCFVLRPDRDTAAVAALRAYAKDTDNKVLAADISNWVGVEKNEPLTLEELKGMGGKQIWIVDKRDGSREWELSQDASDYWEDRDLKEYGKTWFAYRWQKKGN